MTEIVRRAEAMRLGRTKYFTGQPCKRGHIAQRMIGGKCVECHRLHQNGWRRSNPEKVKGYLSSWYEKNKAHVAAYAKAWQEAHPEYSNIKSREWHGQNREYRAAYAKDRRKQFPERVKLAGLRRRSRLADAGPLPSTADLAQIFAAQKGRCAYCRTDLRKLPPSDCHLDHIEPVAKGGNNARSNLQFCCKACNLRKNKKDPIRFARELGMLL